MKLLNGITKGKNKTIKIIAVVAIIGAAVYFGPKLLKNKTSGRVPMMAPQPMPAAVAPTAMPMGNATMGSLGPIASSDVGSSISGYNPSLQTAFRAHSRAALVPGHQKVLI